MEFKDSNSEYLFEPENEEPAPKGTFSIFTMCCCKADKEIDKSYYINRWRKYLVFIALI